MIDPKPGLVGAADRDVLRGRSFASLDAITRSTGLKEWRESG